MPMGDYIVLFSGTYNRCTVVNCHVHTVWQDYIVCKLYMTQHSKSKKFWNMVDHFHLIKKTLLRLPGPSNIVSISIIIKYRHYEKR